MSALKTNNNKQKSTSIDYEKAEVDKAEEANSFGMETQKESQDETSPVDSIQMDQELEMEKQWVREFEDPTHIQGLLAMLINESEYNEIEEPQIKFKELKEPEIEPYESPDPGDIDDIAGRLLREEVLSVWKETAPANLVLTKATAVARASCFDDDVCLAQLYVQLTPGPQFLFYQKIVDKVKFVSRI